MKRLFLPALLLLSAAAGFNKSERTSPLSTEPTETRDLSTTDVETRTGPQTKSEQNRTDEVRQGQEEVDPAFYDATTSPDDMSEKNE